jgi:selT/selW/selH-like putative selenoprotein
MFPDIEVSGELYPPKPINSFISSVLQMAFLLGILCNLFGQHILPPHLAQWLVDNRGMAILCVFMCNVISGQLITTGAFEITYNGTLIFSRIREGRMLSFSELKFLIDQAMQLQL